jgi:hypothetical protein
MQYVERWMKVSIQLYTNFITGHNLKVGDSINWQLQSYTAMLVLLESISSIINADSNYSINIVELIPPLQDTLVHSYKNINNAQLQ